MHQSWRERIGQVFDFGPRIDSRTPTFVPRPRRIRQLQDALAAEGRHVCIDGPSGAGKSSLALSCMERPESLRPYVLIQIVKQMTWPEFCRVLGPELPSNPETTTGIKASLKGLEYSRTTKTGQVNAEDLTEHHVAHSLKLKNATLLVDDADQASDELLARIAALGKLIPQSYASQYCAIVIIGSGDICHRVFQAVPALENRMAQVSVGGFDEKLSCSSFLQRSFDALGLRHPWSEKSGVRPDEQRYCERLLWNATGGLPKALNDFGIEVVSLPQVVDVVTPIEIRLVAEQTILKLIERWAAKFPEFVTLLFDNPVAPALLQLLYRRGLTGTHRISDFSRQIVPAMATPRQFEEALVLLTTSNFLVRTGRHLELLFVKEPSLAHTLRLVAQDPERYAGFIPVDQSEKLQPLLPPEDDDPSLNQADESPGDPEPERRRAEG